MITPSSTPPSSRSGAITSPGIWRWGFGRPPARPRRIKRRYGCAQAALVDRNDTIEVPGIGGREPRILSRRVLCEIIEPRVEEIFRMVRGEIQKSGCDHLIASGIVITGGSTLLEGMPEVAEETMSIPVRRGIPAGVGSGLVADGPKPDSRDGDWPFAVRTQPGGLIQWIRGNGHKGGFGDVYEQMKSVLSKVFQ